MEQVIYIKKSLMNAIETHRGNALRCFFLAWKYWFREDQEMVDALLEDMQSHLRTMWFCEQKLKRGATA